jgi:hypothetical protein
MINKIKTMAIVFLFASANKSMAQSTISTECTKDSVFYKSFLAHIDTTDITKDYSFKIKEFLPEKEQNCFCALLIYVKMFDFLLNNNLDLEFSLLKDPPIIRSSIMSNDPKGIEVQKKSELSQRKRRVFTVYYIFKEAFEENVVAQYEADKSLSLEQDVNNILRYGIYSHPKTLKGMLLTKNADALKKKYRKEMSMLFDQD